MRILNGFVGKQYKNILQRDPVEPERMKALREAFSEFDKNKDGFISQEELTDAMTSFGHVTSNEDVEQMIKVVDSDGNGLIDFREFMNLMENTNLLQSGDKEMENLFNLFDINRDGYITEEEIKTTMKNLGENIRSKDVRKMLREADRNRDGKISFPEFKQMVENGKFI